MPRLAIIGDVHGCVEELDALLGLLAPAKGDRLLFLGDLVDRGPDSLGAVRRARELIGAYPGSVCIAGNHEEKALRARDRGRPVPSWAHAATEEDWAFLEGLPLFVRVPEIGSVLVHGGFFPAFFEKHEGLGDPDPLWRKAKGKKADRMRRFLRTRRVDATGQFVALDAAGQDARHWSGHYAGNEGHAFFGHDPQLDPAEPLRAPFATGLDTGCCFGGFLCAAVLEEGADPREAPIVRVRGKAYADRRILDDD